MIKLLTVTFAFNVDGKRIEVSYKQIGPGMIRERKFSNRFEVFVNYQDGIQWTVASYPNKTNALRILKDSIDSIKQSQ